jgi:RND family efflux transporter MFP subunit
LVIGHWSLASGCSEEQRKPKRARGERLPRVEVTRPKRGSLLRHIKLAATVEPLQRSDLSARVPGTVDYMPRDIDIGRRVRKGQKLIHLAVPDLEADKKHKESMLEQANKQVEQADRALAVARQEVKEAAAQARKSVADAEFQMLRYKRIADLVRAEAQNREVQDEALRQLRVAEAARDAAGASVRTREAKALAAEADLQVAKRKVEVAKADLQRSEAQLSFATITAPFDGVITHRWVDEGAVIKDAGARLLRVMQLDRVRVLIDIPQHDVQHVNAEEDTDSPRKPADTVIVRIPELAEVVSKGEFKGKVTRRSKALDPVTRTMRAEVELDNKAGHLQPGMYGQAELILDERQNVLTIPTTALVPRAKGVVGVYLVANPRGVPLRGPLEFVELLRGLDDGERVEVRGIIKGGKVVPLKGDELIVAKGSGVLRVGDEVQALPSAD